MILVDPKMVDTLKGTTAPPVPDMLADTLSSLDQKMKQILETKHLPEYEKAVMYDQVLNSYLTLADRYRHRPLGKVISVVKTSEAQAEKTQDDEDSQQLAEPRGSLSKLEERALESVPSTMQKNAKLLLQHVQDIGNLSWNARGELVHEGQTIPGSNLADLINDVLRHRKYKPDPRGWEVFTKALVQANVPMELIGNKTRRSWMERQQDKIKGATPKASKRPLTGSSSSLSPSSPWLKY